jgi:hypothetical protein
VGFATRDEALLGRSAFGGLVTLVGFVALHLGSRGGLGSGDVKLGVLIGIAATTISWTALWWP